VVELDRPVDMSAATEAAVDAGAWLRPFRNLVYTMPPFVCAPDDVDLIVAGIHAAVHATLVETSCATVELAGARS